MSDLLGRVLAGGAGPFALLYRPESGAPDTIDVLSGEVTAVERIADLPLRDAHAGHDLLALVPYRQIVERGFVAPDDGAPLLALVIEEQESAVLADVLTVSPNIRWWWDTVISILMTRSTPGWRQELFPRRSARAPAQILC